MSSALRSFGLRAISQATAAAPRQSVSAARLVALRPAFARSSLLSRSLTTTFPRRDENAAPIEARAELDAAASPAPTSSPRGSSRPADPFQDRKLFVGNLPFAATQDWLRTLFEQFGSIRSAVLATQDGRSRGFGFVIFHDQSAKEAALALNGREVEGRQMIVSAAKARTDTHAVLPPSQYLAIENLSPQTTPAEIDSYLSQRGLPAAINTNVIVDRATGLGKGHAYLEFSTVEDATAVQEADDIIIDGSTVETRFARPPRPQGDRGFGGERRDRGARGFERRQEEREGFGGRRPRRNFDEGY